MTDAAFREAYRLHKDMLYRFARRMTGSGFAAEDIVQDAYLALWRNSAAFDPARGTLRAFLLGVARNVALQRVRRDRPWEELDEASGLAGPIDLVSVERAAAIAAAVAALPPLQREALIMAEYEEMSLEEIGCATESELPCVKSRLHRARENLRRVLAPLLEKEGTAYGTGR